MTKTAGVFRCGLILGALVLTLTPAFAAPTAEEIMKKAEAAMNSAKSYQGAWQMSMTMGQMGSMSMNMNIKALPRQKMSMVMAPNGQPTGMMAMGAATMNMRMVDDGKNIWIYYPNQKAYQKGPSQVAQQKMKLSDVAGYSRIGTYKLLRTEKLNGRPTFVIQVIPKSASPQARSQTILLYIDQATNRFKQMKMTGKMPTPPNSSQPPQTMTMSMVVMSESINQPIAPSAFRFTPPPGTKEVKGQLGAPGMGMPGGAPRGR